MWEYKKNLILILLIFGIYSLHAGEVVVTSPSGKIIVELLEPDSKYGMYGLGLSYKSDNEEEVCVIPFIRLGLQTETALFENNLTLLKKSRVELIREQYTAIHGKRKVRENEANERVLSFRNREGKKLDLVVRAYNDGLAFCYHLVNHSTVPVRMQEEFTSYKIPDSAERWLQRFVAHYEGEYIHQKGEIPSGEWGYPALFKFAGGGCWALITEAGIGRDYCATKLSNLSVDGSYQLTFPSVTDGNGTGEVKPLVGPEWHSPWRLVIMGHLSDIVESTLVEDVSEPCRMQETDWIIPGVASWIYWAYNHGTQDYQKVCGYIDLAAEMGWEYTLFDWEWDVMGNGGKLEDAVEYANSKGVKPLIWYNSGGVHNRVSATPRDRLVTSEARRKEFAWLKELGIYGIKVDFFESDKQDMMNYYIDILEDAAEFQLLVNFHGSTLPRGWSRTYPHLMSMEAVFGAEQYNNGPFMTQRGASINTTFPFTRNVVGPMDYTPVTFTNSQHPHQTSYGHELALAVVFESGIQHLADRPEGFYRLPDAVKEFFRHLPVAWDETRLIEGYPGEKCVIARRSGNRWYIGGINGTNHSKEFRIDPDFPESRDYRLICIEDGEHDTTFEITYKKGGMPYMVKTLPRGGFVMILE